MSLLLEEMLAAPALLLADASLGMPNIANTARNQARNGAWVNSGGLDDDDCLRTIYASPERGGCLD